MCWVESVEEQLLPFRVTFPPLTVVEEEKWACKICSKLVCSVGHHQNRCSDTQPDFGSCLAEEI